MYGKGVKDFAFVAFYTIVLSFMREFCMQCIFYPLAFYLGIRSRRKLARFMEQMYTVMYFSVMIPFGLYVMSRSPVWYFNTTAMFEEFPHIAHEGLFKAYYLIQASYWLQQALVLALQLERPRTDVYEFGAHHVVTLTLIWLSYRFHFTYIGLAVYVAHDISDFGLAVCQSTMISVCNDTDLSVDIKSSQLPEFTTDGWILCFVHLCLDLYSTLPQSTNPLGCSHRVRYRWTI